MFKLNLRKNAWARAEVFIFTLYFLQQKFDKEPHYALLKELFIQVRFQDSVNVNWLQFLTLSV